MDARFNALARATGGRPRFITLHTFVKKMVAIALSSVAVARQSALTRKVQGTSSSRKSFRRFVAVSSTHQRRVAAFDGMEMEWISDASARPSPPVCASGVRFDELRIVKSDVVSVQNGSQSRVRIAIRFPFRVMRRVRRRATTRRCRCARGSVRMISYHRMPSVDASVDAVDARVRAGGRTRTIDRSMGRMGAIRSLDMVLIGT